ncbi:FAD-dependent monooxygenase [Massilia sp. BJB1822]|uniref:FAD-dependent monooxygenase n=1 Tax=Massilia sp. BJB1822 TaxID=2744470 RepID=UPI001594C85E|nr:FAD-dependent monooxygenase [Massilia sp. BJB1822]NVE01756.1 FAD-dependent monooxygenase [Massilia sp. BJB1822]
MVPSRILISGAGIGGLCAAWWLARMGAEVHLVEKAASLREEGYMIGVAGLAHGVLDEMGLLPRLRQFAIPFERSLYLDGAGRRIMSLDHGRLMAQLGHMVVLRSDLAALLYEGMRDRASLQLNTSIAALAQDSGGVDVRFSDGSGGRFDYVIGADGFRSATRRLVFGADQDCCRHLGLWAGAYWLPDVGQLEEDMLTYAEPRRMSMYYRIGDGRIAALHIWKSQQEAVPPALRRVTLEAAFSGSHARVLQGLAQLPPQDELYLDAVMQVELPAWTRGRVALLGDAAHCLSLANGQGASMALAGARCLARELAVDPSPAALLRYQHCLQPAIQALQQRGRKAARLYVPDSALACRLRNLAMRAVPQTMLARYFMKSAKEEAGVAGSLAWEGRLRLPQDELA